MCDTAEVGNAAAMSDAGDTGLLTTMFQETVYQCSGCRLASTRKNKIMDHLARKNPKPCCVGARLLSGVCALSIGMPPGTINAAHDVNNLTQTGDHNTQVQNNVHVTLPVDSPEYLKAIAEAVKADILNVLLDIDPDDPATIPAKLFRRLVGRDAPPALQNVSVKGNDVVERCEAGERHEPLGEYSKRKSAELFSVAASAVSQAAANDATTSEDVSEAAKCAAEAFQAPIVEASQLYAQGDPAVKQHPQWGTARRAALHVRAEARLCKPKKRK